MNEVDFSGGKASKDNREKISILSYNIQAGSNTSSYREYLTKSWKQVLPHRNQQKNLDQIGRLIKPFDLVGLQEVDGGSLRSGFVNQTGYLASKAGFPYWFTQPNRNIGKLGQYSNGILSRFKPARFSHHKLPGLPGRGILVSEFGEKDSLLAVIVAHLALGKRSRRQQVFFLDQLISRYPHVILMGDFNCGCDCPDMRYLFNTTKLKVSSCQKNTFPSWNPVKRIDHILVSKEINVCSSEVVNYPLSDHLPVHLVVELPEQVHLTGREELSVAG